MPDDDDNKSYYQTQDLGNEPEPKKKSQGTSLKSVGVTLGVGAITLAATIGIAQWVTCSDPDAACVDFFRSVSETFKYVGEQDTEPQSFTARTPPPPQTPASQWEPKLVKGLHDLIKSRDKTCNEIATLKLILEDDDGVAHSVTCKDGNRYLVIVKTDLTYSVIDQ